MLYPETGYGALQRSRNLLLELCKENEVFLIAYYRKSDRQLVPDPEIARKDLEQYCKRVIIIPHYIDGHGIRKYAWLLKSLFSKVPFSVYLFRSEIIREKILALIATCGISVVHADTLGLMEDMLDKIEILKVLNHHNIESDMMYRRSRKESNPVIKTSLKHEAKCLREYEKKFCPAYDMNITVSDLDNERLKDINESIICSTIENGVDCNYYKYHPRSGNCSGLIFAGSLDWYPNADALLFFCRDIWPGLKRLHKGLTFTVIGKNPPDKLRLLMEGDKDIYFKGYVPDVRPYIRDSMIFVSPFRDGGGTRLKILDAMSQGIPVVSTALGCEGINISEGGNILIADTADDFISKISDLLTMPDLADQLSKGGRALVEKQYSFEVLGRKMRDLYENLQKGV